MPDLSDGESDDYRLWSDEYLTIDLLYLHLLRSGVGGGKRQAVGETASVKPCAGGALGMVMS
jgi:hypothetical protein